MLFGSCFPIPRVDHDRAVTAWTLPFLSSGRGAPTALLALLAPSSAQEIDERAQRR